MEQLAKTNAVRIADVVFIAPVMLYAATRLPKSDRPLAWILGALGALTALYNARNYLQTLDPR